MGRVLLIGRLAARDIRHRPTSVVLLVLATVLGTAAAVAAITAVPAWLGTRRPAGEALQSELA